MVGERTQQLPTHEALAPALEVTALDRDPRTYRVNEENRHKAVEVPRLAQLVGTRDELLGAVPVAGVHARLAAFRERRHDGRRRRPCPGPDRLDIRELGRVELAKHLVART